jgi:hypothetical protein
MLICSFNIVGFYFRLILDALYFRTNEVLYKIRLIYSDKCMVSIAKSRIHRACEKFEWDSSVQHSMYTDGGRLI